MRRPRIFFFYHHQVWQPIAQRTLIPTKASLTTTTTTTTTTTMTLSTIKVFRNHCWYSEQWSSLNSLWQKGFSAGTKEPLTKTQTKMVEGWNLNEAPGAPSFGSTLFKSVGHVRQLCQLSFPTRPAIHPSWWVLDSRQLRDRGVRAHGHPGMPPQRAELGETKCPFVLEKVELVTLIYPGRRSHPGLALVPLSPVDVPGRADRTQEECVWSCNQGKGW